MATRYILAVLLQMAVCISGDRPHTTVVRPYSGYHLNTGITTSVDGAISRSGDINITVNVFSSGLFRKKETLGWHPGKSYDESTKYPVQSTNVSSDYSVSSNRRVWGG